MPTLWVDFRRNVRASQVQPEVARVPSQNDSAPSEPLPVGVRSNEAAQPRPVDRLLVPPAGSIEMVGIPPVLSHAANQLLTQAREVMKDTREEQWRFAVVLAHAACDLRTEQAISDLIKWKNVEYLRDALQKTRRGNLSNGGVRKVYAALSGDSPWRQPKETGEPPQAPWWQAWTTSYEVRCRVAHAGAPVTRQEAEKSIDVCEKYVLHLMHTVDRLTSR